MSSANGRTRIHTDPLDPARAQALFASLGLDGVPPQKGDHLPPFWHHIYFWEALGPAFLGRDGHPKTGGFIPDTGLPRRMWAGGSLEFLMPVLLGETAEKTSTVSALERKSGRSGDLAVVTLRHELRQGGALAVIERQDLIYRQDPEPETVKTTPPSAPEDEDFTHQVAFSPTLLFRYSALTFNGHRIHYDRDYCQSVEGYAGLVVHGPLLAQLLIHLADDTLNGLQRFSFRATAPLFDFETAELCYRRVEGGLSLWVRGPDGRLCMTAEAG